ncbi:MAG: DNA recombination protein RmuC [Gammaproteobacteria bacterium]
MTLVFIAIALVIGLILGYVFALLLGHRRNSELQIELGVLKAKAEAANASREDLEKTFKALAGDVLRNNNQSFLELATQNLGKFHVEAKSELDKKEKAFADLVKPIGDALKKTEEHIHLIEKERKEAYGGIANYLKNMADTQQQLSNETRNLVSALRRPEVRGRWGEMTLQRVVELAGMVEYCDFVQQEQLNTDDGALRPDMIVRMPEHREIVVDAKTPVDAYLDAIEAKDDTQRQIALECHVRNVRARVRELASKAYWSQFQNSPEFVVLFIPGDQFLAPALEKDPTLQDDALREGVVIATPSNFMALLKVIAYGWRQMTLEQNAGQIRIVAEELYKRLITFVEHLDILGKHIGKSVEYFNKSVGSLERQVLPGARKFVEMGVQAKKSMPELDQLEAIPRITGNEASDDSDT